MATTAMDYESANGDRYDDEAPRYERDPRSASPRPSRDDGMEISRRRSASPGANHDRGHKDENGSKDEDGSINPGSNLFVTGIHPRLSETEVTRLFEKYGEVEKCQIMKDPHTKESRGFGFVKMVTSDQADAAKDGLQGEVIEGRTLSIEKARRARPRTPTPGKYFGPPKREGRGGGRFEERRRGGGYGGGYGGREDPYRYRGYDRQRHDDRGDRGYRDDRGGYDRSYRDDRSSGYAREERGYDRGYERRDREEGYSGGAGGGRVDRYGSGGGGREDRGDRYDRRGGGSGGYDRERYDRDGPRTREPAAAAGYSETASRTEPRDTYGGAP
ncbi:hypothetical protein MGN70_004329 [Eutypa lata]|uniref:Putative transformer-sr ribonucleo protein n=1 Tax=Eutypa lata (strain UCR-EL1) TaxID=1287681 RepID=M7ST43_EUTLA|nr:putative transformer-sr ribonucleo protein [Eutypa lata UCREL1]KAI1253934.1 hypothetical protein MGN70_004329 [Eutypa lata]